MTIERRTNGQFCKGTHWRSPKPFWEREWLRREYIDKKRSTYEIAADFGCGAKSIQNWLRKLDIPVRTTSESRAVKYWGLLGKRNPMYGRNGSLNPNYKDGSSPERQLMYARGEGKDFLKAVYKRDNYKCRRCGQEKTVPRSIHAHHIKPWAGNHKLRFDINNAVTLCRSCHEWVHSNANLLKEWIEN